MRKFDALIFDIGNVIINIDYATATDSFQKLVPEGPAFSFSSLVAYGRQTHLFDSFETGKITVPQFRKELKKFLRPGISDEEIDRAWNSIIIDYPAANFELLTALQKRYRIFALSNINDIHLQTINKAVNQKFNAVSLDSFFHKAYYSHLMGLRKPEKEVYTAVLERENLDAEKTFFVDDLQANVDVASSLGLHAFQINKPHQLADLLKKLNII